MNTIITEHPNAALVRRGYIIDESASWHTPGQSPLAGDAVGRNAVFAQFGRYRQGTDGTFRFDTDDGTRTLAELFDGRSQLVVYHFMFGPSYEAGCTTCSSLADAVNGIVPHLNARDVTMLFVSQAPLEKLQTYKRRMGWSFPWVSSANSEFNFDLGYSSSEEQTREWVAPILEALPPIADRMPATAAPT